MAEIFGTNGDDILTGTGGRDEIIGRKGDDLLQGNDGNDELIGGGGNDTLDGGAGNDELIGGKGADTFVVGEGNDTIEGLRDDDMIQLLPMTGITSFDELLAAAAPTGGGDNTYIDFGGGNGLLLENVRLSDLSAAQFGFDVGPPTEPPPDGGQTLVGTSRPDVLVGGDGDDDISGLGGADELVGANGHDTISGGGGRDELFGGSGDDILSGDGGRDELLGGDGNDRLDGGAGNDELRGGEGSDIFVFAIGKDTIEDFGDGDRIELDASSLGVGSFDDLMDLAELVGGGDDVLFRFDDATSLLLEDTNINTLNAGDFLFA